VDFFCDMINTCRNQIVGVDERPPRIICLQQKQTSTLPPLSNCESMKKKPDAPFHRSRRDP
ncbi:MAG TPA: hypothetical protein PLC21_09390, partial [Deltaproteobacteria bacterium]|nr:hypothetical protein [Deltaproteobacteria bacterium]